MRHDAYLVPITSEGEIYDCRLVDTGARVDRWALFCPACGVVAGAAAPGTEGVQDEGQLDDQAYHWEEAAGRLHAVLAELDLPAPIPTEAAFGARRLADSGFLVEDVQG